MPASQHAGKNQERVVHGRPIPRTRQRSVGNDSKRKRRRRSMSHSPVQAVRLEQVGSTQAATLIVTVVDGSTETFQVRPAEAKLLRLLQDVRTNHERVGFSTPGWVRVGDLASTHDRIFGTRMQAATLHTHLHRLRRTLRRRASDLLESNRRSGVRLRVAVHFLSGNAGTWGVSEP
ncbi:MAG TPA: hypothetical protein VF384_18525 [Planctomycetota bacterium]